MGIVIKGAYGELYNPFRMSFLYVVSWVILDSCYTMYKDIGNG